MKYWIYDYDEKRFKKVMKNRLVFDYPYTPDNKVYMIMRGNDKFQYVPWGVTYEDCWDRATAYEQKELIKARIELDRLWDMFNKKYGPRSPE